MIRTVVTTAIATNATRLNTPVACGNEAALTPAGKAASACQRLLNKYSTVPGVVVSCGGIFIPKSASSPTKYPLQPEATVAAPNAYSSTRSHPMIHATNSPSVAYPYV